MMSRWRSGRRVGIAPVAILVLLILHHPSMGVMPALSMAGWGGPIAMMSSGDTPTGALDMGIGQSATCPACLEVCPMHAVGRGRSTVRPPAPPAHAPLSWARDATVDAHLSGIRTAHARALLAERWAPPARARQAILGVFLL